MRRGKTSRGRAGIDEDRAGAPVSRLDVVKRVLFFGGALLIFPILVLIPWAHISPYPQMTRAVRIV